MAAATLMNPMTPPEAKRAKTSETVREDGGLRALGPLIVATFPIHRTAFVFVNVALTVANVVTGPPWWGVWPLLITGALFCVHWLTVASMRADESWADARAKRLQERSYDHGHIEDIIDRRVAASSHQSQSETRQAKKSSGSTHASRAGRISALLMVAAALLIGPLRDQVHAHSWYPYECCDDGDCAPVISTERLSLGQAIIVVSKFGRVEVPDSFPRRPSQDNQMHICILRTPNGPIPRCFFVPGLS
ncbi:MAG: 2TM domain-containing protein [Pseudomonadota bacterium]